MDSAVRFHDVVSVWSYVLIFLATLPACGWFASRIDMDDATKSNLVSLFSGLISAQGIIVSFAMSANESLLSMVTESSFHLFRNDAASLTLFHTFADILNYIGILGIVVLGIGAFVFITRTHRHFHKTILALGLSFFVFEIISIVRTYQLIHTLRLLNMETA